MLSLSCTAQVQLHPFCFPTATLVNVTQILAVSRGQTVSDTMNNVSIIWIEVYYLTNVKRGRTSVVARLFETLTYTTDRWISVSAVCSVTISLHQFSQTHNHSVVWCADYTKFHLIQYVLCIGTYIILLRSKIWLDGLLFFTTCTRSKLHKNPAFVKIHSNRTKSKTDTRTHVSTMPFFGA